MSRVSRARGGCADSRLTLQVLLEILIEELHNHLYLKSFYCDVRWKSYSRGQSACESYCEQVPPS